MFAPLRKKPGGGGIIANDALSSKGLESRMARQGDMLVSQNNRMT
jgi:hypothetical protein